MTRIWLIATLLIGCAGSTHPGDPGRVTTGVQVQLGHGFDIAFGQEVQVQGTGLTIRFVAIRDDSRCPLDVQCVWAGNAIVALVLSSPGAAPAEVVLNTTVEPKLATYAGHTVTLTNLKPFPRSGTAIEGSAYVATLEVRPVSG